MPSGQDEGTANFPYQILLVSFHLQYRNGFWSNFCQPSLFFISNEIKLLRAVTCNPEFSFLPLKKQMRVTRICSVLLCDCAKMAFSGKMYMVAIW